VTQEENRHLTTEQLSALLDKQLSAQEETQYEAHLRSCQQCQGMLDDLRQTVALLHALPQPTLPRSFVLTPEMLRTATPSEEPAVPVTIQIEERRRQRQQRQQRQQGLRTLDRNQARRSVLPRTLRVMSTLVALLGFLFLVSAIPFHGGATGTSSTGTVSNSSATAVPSSPTMGPHAVGTKPPGTPAVAPAKTPVATYQPASNNSHASTNQRSSAHGSPGVSTILQWFGFFDSGTPGGRAIDGLLLLALALVGLIIVRRWRARDT
jgi:anti-sigma factor RsiW